MEYLKKNKRRGLLKRKKNYKRRNRKHSKFIKF